MSRKPSKPETRIEDYLDVMTGGNAALPQPILRIEFYYAYLAGMAVQLPQPILDDEKLLAKICGMEVEAPTYIPGISPRLYAYMAKKGGQDVQVPDPILRLECYWYDYSAGAAPSVQEYTGAVPVTFIADGTPLLDYLISGNTVQSGTPTPDSPIVPQGTGEMSAQLIPYPFYSSDGKYAGVQFTTDNGRIIANGTLTSGLLYYLWRPAKFPAGTYTMSVKGKHSGATIYFRDTTNSVSVASIYGAQEGDRSVTFTVAEEISAMVYINAGSGSVDFDCTIMLNAGEEALPFEPTNGYKIPISSAGQTNPVYLGEVQTTRKIKKLVLTGEETFVATTSGPHYRCRTALVPKGIAQSTTAVLSTHYLMSAGARDGTITLATNGGIVYFTDDTNAVTAEAFKTYLQQQYAAGTPVTVWYILASEETAAVNEPLMKIGDYADTLSMEQAGVQIPTANGSTTLDVETTVKPSEVYIKYRGEAVATLSTLSAEVSSPEATTVEENPKETEEEENER